jgi:hypothetical protein
MQIGVNTSLSVGSTPDRRPLLGPQFSAGFFLSQPGFPSETSIVPLEFATPFSQTGDIRDAVELLVKLDPEILDIAPRS